MNDKETYPEYEPVSEGRDAPWERLEGGLPPKGSDCPLTAQLIQFALGELDDAATREMVKLHLRDCRGCVERVRGLKQAHEQLAAEPTSAPAELADESPPKGSVLEEMAQVPELAETAEVAAPIPAPVGAAPLPQGIHIPIGWLVMAAFLLIIVVGGGAAGAKYLHDKLAEIARLRQEYEQAWAELRFEEVVRPTIQVLPATGPVKPNRVRVELSPRIDEGLVRGVFVKWDDTTDQWDLIYDRQKPPGEWAFAAAHAYPLPPIGKLRSWLLQVKFEVPDAVAAAQLLSPDKLTFRCRVVATADGLQLAPAPGGQGPEPKLRQVGLPQITWISPAQGAQVGFKPRVILKSKTATEKITLLVRPHSGSTFFVQAGACPLAAGIPQQFEVQLTGSRSHLVGMDFDILAVCDNNFQPKQWDLETYEVPHSSVAGRITVRKAAGRIEAAAGLNEDSETFRVKGEIWTSDGGALVVKDSNQFKVLRVLEPSPTGGVFETTLKVPPSQRNAIYLIVRQDGQRPLAAGAMIPETAIDSCWLYGPAKKTDSVSPLTPFY